MRGRSDREERPRVRMQHVSLEGASALVPRARRRPQDVCHDGLMQSPHGEGPRHRRGHRRRRGCGFHVAPSNGGFRLGCGPARDGSHSACRCERSCILRDRLPSPIGNLRRTSHEVRVVHPSVVGAPPVSPSRGANCWSHWASAVYLSQGPPSWLLSTLSPDCVQDLLFELRAVLLKAFVLRRGPDFLRDPRPAKEDAA